MTFDRPRILVTLGSDLPAGAESLRLPRSYIRALVSQGAVPVLVPSGIDAATVEDFIAQVDGILLPGGVDLHPRRFDEDVHPMTVIDEDLDELEFATVEAARRARLPILGICRGSQVLNVAFGGNLIQHLEPAQIDHKPDGPLDRHIHGVQLRDGTRLRDLTGSDEMQVNSWHHQAIGRVGSGLQVAAIADDGVIEAIESADANEWIVGVQYHPEELLHLSPHHALLADFVGAATRARATTPVSSRAPA